MNASEMMRRPAPGLAEQGGSTQHRASVLHERWRAWRAAPPRTRLIVGLGLSASATVLVWLVMYALYLAVATAPLP